MLTWSPLRKNKYTTPPAPRFETDDDRLACLIRLPAHPLAKRPTPEDTDQVTGQVTGQVTAQVTGEVARLLAAAAQGEQTRSALQEALGLKHTPHFRQAYLLPALEGGLIEMTLPDKPNSRNQRYRLTAKGRQWLSNDCGKTLGS
jgi:ATP-dependent DNA helicase RecG